MLLINIKDSTNHLLSCPWNHFWCFIVWHQIKENDTGCILKNQTFWTIGISTREQWECLPGRYTWVGWVNTSLYILFTLPEQRDTQWHCSQALEWLCLGSDCSGTMLSVLLQTSFQRKTCKPKMRSIIHHRTTVFPGTMLTSRNLSIHFLTKITS